VIADTGLAHHLSLRGIVRYCIFLLQFEKTTPSFLFLGFLVHSGLLPSCVGQAMRAHTAVAFFSETSGPTILDSAVASAYAENAVMYSTTERENGWSWPHPKSCSSSFPLT
jgi:hypothetical protein